MVLRMRQYLRVCGVAAARAECISKRPKHCGITAQNTQANEEKYKGAKRGRTDIGAADAMAACISRQPLCGTTLMNCESKSNPAQKKKPIGGNGKVQNKKLFGPIWGYHLLSPKKPIGGQKKVLVTEQLGARGVRNSNIREKYKPPLAPFGLRPNARQFFERALKKLLIKTTATREKGVLGV